MSYSLRPLVALRSLSCTIGIAALASCAVTVDASVHDPSFTIGALSQGGMAIAGMTTVEGQLGDEEQIELANQLATALREDRPSLTVASGLDVSRALGTAQAAALGELASDARVSAPTLGTLAGQGAQSFQYAAFVRIDRDQIDESSTTEFVKGSGSARTKYETRRDITATLSVYDLRSQALVWQGTGTKSQRNVSDSSGSNSEIRDELIGGAVEELLTGTSQYRVPPPPRAEMLVAIFEGFAAALPGAPD